MMKKKLFTILAAGMAAGLSAQVKESENILDKLIWDDKMLNILIDTRVDFQADFQEGDVTDLSFRGQTIKLWFVGEIVPGIRYRLRQRLNKPQEPLREGYSAATDQAWVAFDIGKRWTITAGKQSVQFGTFEYDYNPADIYLGTMCFNDLDAYKTGVNVAYRFAKQTLNLQVVNSDYNQFADEEYKNKALALNLLWEGSLFSDVLRTRVGYGAFQHNGDSIYSWITAGLQLNVEKFTAELDYYNGRRNMDYSSVVGTEGLGNRVVQDQSAAVNLKYDLGKWKPSVKAVWNQRYDKEYDATAYTNAGIQALVEFYPFSGLVKDLNFHAMYSYQNTDYKGQFSELADADVHTALVGFRWLFKVK